MRKLSILFSAAFTVVSAALFYLTLDIPGASEWDVVGSRAVPQIYVAGMGLSSAAVLAGSLIAEQKAGWGSWPALSGLAARYGRVLVVFLALLAWAFAIGVTGFYSSAAAFLLFLTWYLDGRRMSWPAAATALLCPAVIWAVFEKGLKVMMPSGLLF
ncbi:MAG: tripartite tricarboxylate transporter TctB family protein [Duodenibacillus sp.]|nr:tripartite tricarboxylate transporter TctB family protein [Duodenibacillus sp.]